jgi:hypothetical protein
LNATEITSLEGVGEAEHNVALDEVTFDMNRKQFQTKGVALAPDGSTIVKEKGHYRPVPNLFSHDGQSLGHAKRQKIMELNAQRPLLVEGSDDEAIYGIWGPPTPHELQEKIDSKTDIEAGNPLLPEQVAERAYMEELRRKMGIQETEGEEEVTQRTQKYDYDRLVGKKMSHLLPPRLADEEAKPIEPSTKFHSSAEYDLRVCLGRCLRQQGLGHINSVTWIITNAIQMYALIVYYTISGANVTRNIFLAVILICL